MGEVIGKPGQALGNQSFQEMKSRKKGLPFAFVKRALEREPKIRSV